MVSLRGTIFPNSLYYRGNNRQLHRLFHPSWRGFSRFVPSRNRFWFELHSKWCLWIASPRFGWNVEMSFKRAGEARGGPSSFPLDFFNPTLYHNYHAVRRVPLGLRIVLTNILPEDPVVENIRGSVQRRLQLCRGGFLLSEESLGVISGHSSYPSCC